MATQGQGAALLQELLLRVLVDPDLLPLLPRHLLQNLTQHSILMNILHIDRLPTERTLPFPDDDLLHTRETAVVLAVA